MSAASRLDRVHVTIGRAAEYFSANELEKQTGQPRSRFAAMAIKELVDNALDAAETTGVPPEVAIDAATDGAELRLSVSDNGPGLPADVLGRILDFDTRTSDKLAYRAPTRGLQGNALKTIIGLPMALGGDAPAVIETGGRRHEIRARVDPVGNAVVEHDVSARPTPTGTTVSLVIPGERQRLDAVQWARSFSLLNPHASVSVKTRGLGDERNHAQCGDPVATEIAESYQPLVAFPEPWTKWLPSDPTSPHWYDAATLQMLVYGQASSPLLRDFVRQFEGLTGTQKAKAITDRFPGIKRLDEIAHGPAAVAALLAAMKGGARPVTPRRLGHIGGDAIRARFADWYGIEGDRFWYEKQLDVDHDGTPFVVEVAIAQTSIPGPVVYGLNFSPAFGDPFADAWLRGGKIDRAHGIAGFLGIAHVLPPSWLEQDIVSTPTAALVHVVSPRLTTLDRGKSRLAPSPDVVAAVGEALWRTSKTLYGEGERRKKDAAKQARRDANRIAAWAKSERAGRLTQKDAIYSVIPEAYDFVTGGGAMRASAHTLFYQIRPRVLELIGEQVESRYTEHTVIPEYEREHGGLPLLYREPRGVLYEPHSGVAVPLGTLDVEAYELPAWRFDKILFVEKTGLWPVINDAGIANRYDLAVIASNGFSPVACRALLARAREQDIRVFVLHDADRSGYDICRTLAEPTERMPEHAIEVIDLGLAFEDGIARGLPIEPQKAKGALSKKLAPRLTERERQAFTGTRTRPMSEYWDLERIELNAFSSPALIAFIEEKLTEHNATSKFVPPLDTLQTNVRDTARPELAEIVHDEIVRRLDVDGIVDRVLASALVRGIENDAVTSASEDTIAELLTKDRTRPWEWVLREHVVALIDAERDEINAAIDAALPKAERSS